MSTNINVNVDLAGILARLKEQQQASRQAQLEKVANDRFEDQLREALAQRQSILDQQVQQTLFDTGRKIVRDELSATALGRTPQDELPSSYDIDISGEVSADGDTLITFRFWKRDVSDPFAAESCTVGPLADSNDLFPDNDFVIQGGGITGIKWVISDKRTLTCKINGQTFRYYASNNLYYMKGCRGYQDGFPGLGGPFVDFRLELTFEASSGSSVPITDAFADNSLGACPGHIILSRQTTIPPPEALGIDEFGQQYVDFSIWTP